MFTIPPPSTSSSSTSEENPHISTLTWRGQHTNAPLPASELPPLVTSVQPGTVASFPLRFRQSSAYTASRIALRRRRRAHHPPAGRTGSQSRARRRESSRGNHRVRHPARHGSRRSDDPGAIFGQQVGQGFEDGRSSRWRRLAVRARWRQCDNR